MPTLFMEGFGQCPTGEQDPDTSLRSLLFNWNHWDDNVNNPTISALASGSQGTRNYIQFPTAISNLRAKPWVPHTYSSWTIGMRIYRDTAAECLIGSFEGCGFFGVKSTGELAYQTHAAGDINGTSIDSIAQIPEDTWTYCEWKMTFGNGTAGSVTFYIDGAESGDHQGIDTIGSFSTATTTPAGIAIGQSVSGNAVQPTWRFADIYVSTEQLGPVEVWYQECDQAGSASDFTPSAGANEDNVDEVGDPDGDTTYNESTTPGNKDSLGHNVTHTGLGPAGVQAMAAVRAVGGGFAQVRVGVNSGAVEVWGGTEQITEEGWRTMRGPIQATDPATGSAWTKGGADAAETTIQHVA